MRSITSSREAFADAYLLAIGWFDAALIATSVGLSVGSLEQGTRPEPDRRGPELGPDLDGHVLPLPPGDDQCPQRPRRDLQLSQAQFQGGPPAAPAGELVLGQEVIDREPRCG